MKRSQETVDYRCVFCKSPICWEIDCNAVTNNKKDKTTPEKKRKLKRK